jgi:hypothetical protein
MVGAPWRLALARPLEHTRRQSAPDEMQGAKDIDRLVTIEMADQGPVAFDTPGGAPRGNQGNARGIWAPQSPCPGVRVFFQASRSGRAAACCAGSPVR